MAEQLTLIELEPCCGPSKCHDPPFPGMDPEPCIFHNTKRWHEWFEDPYCQAEWDPCGSCGSPPFLRQKRIDSFTNNGTECAPGKTCWLCGDMIRGQ